MSERTWIYAFQQGEDGPIKIGSAKDPEKRLATLQCGNPTELRPLGAWWAPPEHEHALHGALKHVRVRGEWFEPTPALLFFIEFMEDEYWFDMPDEIREGVEG